jgi:hypothetical protein
VSQSSIGLKDHTLATLACQDTSSVPGILGDASDTADSQLECDRYRTRKRQARGRQSLEGVGACVSRQWLRARLFTERERGYAKRIPHAVKSLTAMCLAAVYRGVWMAGRPGLNKKLSPLPESCRQQDASDRYHDCKRDTSAELKGE